MSKILISCLSGLGNFDVLLLLLLFAPNLEDIRYHIFYNILSICSSNSSQRIGSLVPRTSYG